MLKGKKILFVSQYCGFFGGIERYAFSTAQIFRGQGASIGYLYTERARSFQLFQAGFDTVTRSLPKEGEYDFCIIHKVTDNTLLKELFTLFGKKCAVIVHDHDLYCPRKYYYTPFGRKNCSRAYSFFPCAFCGMCVSPSKMKNGILAEIVEKFHDFGVRMEMMRSAGKLVVLSGFMRENLIKNGFSPDSVSIVHPAIPLPREQPRRKENAPLHIAFTGQLIRGKGADLFLSVLTKLDFPYESVVAGDGPDRKKLEMLAKTLGTKTRFAGYTHTPEKIYSASDVVVLPCRWQEPFGLVGAEAAASGCALTAFHTGGAGEYIRDGINGFLVPPGDLNAMAEALKRLNGDRALLRSMGQKSKELVEAEFSERRFLSAFQTLMKEAVP